ncbi:MAG: preQ(1) synthase [Thermoanaerobaculia bacterium]
MSEDTRLPKRGPLPRPESVESAREQLKQEAFPAPDVQLVTMNAEEFTAICPRTGQPDFGQVSIEYRPASKCLESKALKYYLWAYRDEGAFCETLAARMAEDVVFAIDPIWVRVEVRQNVRGGISIVAAAERGSGSAPSR